MDERKLAEAHKNWQEAQGVFGRRRAWDIYVSARDGISETEAESLRVAAEYPDEEKDRDRFGLLGQRFAN